MYRIRGEDRLEIKQITEPGEREYYGDLIARRHYLGSSQINSRTLVHVAKRGREEVAIVTWEPGTRHWFGLRDKLIGWSESQKKQRLKYCFENRRFLVLVKEPNLASHVLSKSMYKLAEDAAKIYGHECLLVETFVDPSKQFEGTCYRAAGWTDVGMTRGGRGSQVRSPKKYFVKELKSQALIKLKSPDLTPSDTVNPRQSVLSLETFDLRGLKKRLDSIVDYRKHQGWYPLSSLLALTIAAVLSGESTLSAIHRWISGLSQELLRGLGCRKCPSYAVIRSTLINIDHAAFSDVLCSWLKEQDKKIHIDKKIRILSLDGKRLRAASSAKGTDIHILELIDSVTQVVQDQMKVSDKENEIPVAREMLARQTLNAETIITADALHTQKKTAELIQKKNAHYIFAVKDNQKNLRKAIIEETPEEAWSIPFYTHELEHGRITVRSIKVAPLQPSELDFPGARSIAIVTRSGLNKKTGSPSLEHVAYITSLVDPDPKTLLALIRGHWTIENCIFGRRDIFFQEDRSTVRTKYGPYNMALLRSFTIGIAKLSGFDYIPNAVNQFKKLTPKMLNYFKVPVGLEVI